MRLLKALSLETGNMMVLDTLSQASGFNYQQLKTYLGVLEKTFVCRTVQPFHTNKSTELAKTPKIFFFDTGFRNIAADSFEISGAMYENLVFSEMFKQNLEVKYWRTKAKAEVDFIINDKIPVEVKAKIVKDNVPRSFLSFIERYEPEKGYVLSSEFEGIKNVKNTKVHFLPFVKFLNKVCDSLSSW